MTYLVYVGLFGLISAFFLWFRDLRIFVRSALPGYRRAAYRGVLYTALATMGFFLAYFGQDLIGLGVILGALYLQGRIEREKIWTNEGTIQRFLGDYRGKKR